MNTPVTYAIPYFKGLTFLENAIQSVIDQENPNWKLIVIDDQGGEDAESLVLSFSDDRLTFVRNETTLGMSANWNKALSLVNTELVTILHADDELLPNYTDVVTSLMGEYPDATAVHCRTVIINEHGNETFSLPDMVKKIVRPRGKKNVVTYGEEGLKSLTKGQWIFCPTMCYRKSLIPTGNFSNDWMMVLDLELMSRILLDGGSIVGSPVEAYRYRRHSNNQTVKLTNSNKRFEEEIKLLDIIGGQCRQRGWNRAANSAQRKTVIRLHMLYQGLLSIGNLRMSRARKLFLGALTLRLE
jgi:glycosyltransferase involved in cell wall biosynthesis